MTSVWEASSGAINLGRRFSCVQYRWQTGYANKTTTIRFITSTLPTSRRYLVPHFFPSVSTGSQVKFFGNVLDGSVRKCLTSRKFSTEVPPSASSPSHTKSLEDVLGETTQRILKHDVGSMTTSVWSEAHASILSWLGYTTAQSIARSFELLDRLVQEEAATELRRLPDFYTTDLLNLIVNHWRMTISGNVNLRTESSLQPQVLVNRLMEHHKLSSSGASVVQPNTQTFSMVVDGSIYFTDGVHVADRLVDWIIAEAPEHSHLQPNVYTFSSLMNAWVKSKDPQAPSRAENILELMHELHSEFPEWNVAPNQITYATAIDAWAKVGRVDRAEQLLHDMHAAYKENGMEHLKPNLPAFNGLLVALARAGEMERAQKVLEQMEALYESGELDDEPSVISYSTVLSAFGKSSKRGTAQKAEHILRHMKDRGVRANVISWNTVIDAYAKEKNPERAEALLREMTSEYEQGNKDVKPSMRTYAVVLSAWSAKQSIQSGEQGERLMELMIKLHESGELEEPDVIAYNSVLACWARSGARDAGARANDFLHKMIGEGKMKPDAYSFNTVSSALVRDGRLEDAENLLKIMKDNEVAPDVTAYNTLLNAWIKSGRKDAPKRVECLHRRMKADPDIQPDLFTMNTLLHFYSRTGNPEAAEILIEEMCSQESTVQPDSISFNTAISAWTSSKRPESPMKAELILSQMMEHRGRAQPNVITFNSVLNAWVKSRPTEALAECKRLVGAMFDLVEDGNYSVQPDAITYNTLIHAHGVSGDEDAAFQAEAIFREMDRRYEEGDTRLRPTTHTLGSLINGWSKCKHPEAGERAEEILRIWIERANSGEMRERPKAAAFTSTMKAHTNSGDPLAAYRVDALLYLLLREYNNGNKFCLPDHWVFVAILEALVASPVPNKKDAAKRLVRIMKEFNIRPDRQKISLLKQCVV